MAAQTLMLIVGMTGRRKANERISMRTMSVALIGSLTAFVSVARAALGQGLPELVWNRSLHFGLSSHAASFSPCGSMIAVANEMGAITIMAGSDGRVLRVLKDRIEDIRCVAFSPDSKILVSGGEDGIIILWKMSDGSVLRKLGGYTASVGAICFSPDGDLLASGGTDQTVRIWRVEDGRLLFTLKGHTGSIESVCFSPQGKTIASAGWDKTIRVWDVAERRERYSIDAHSDVVTCVAFSGDGKTLASSSHDRTIKLWRSSDGSIMRTCRGHLSWVQNVVFSREGSFLVSLGGFMNRCPKIWDSRNGLCLQTLEEYEASCLALSPDSTLVAIGGNFYDETVKLWRISDGNQVRLGHNSFDKNPIAFSPDGRILATGSWDGKARLWKADDGAFIRVLSRHKFEVTALAFSPVGDLMASGAADSTVEIWRVKDGVRVRRLEPGWPPQFLAFSRDGTLLASCGGFGGSSIKVWKIETGVLVKELRGHGSLVTSGVFSTDGSHLISGSSDGTARMWRVSDGALLWTVPGFDFGVSGIQLSPDGKTLAVAWLSKVVFLNLQGKTIAALEQECMGIEALPFSPDGTRLATSGEYNLRTKKYEGLVTLWRVSDGDKLSVLSGHTGPVKSLAFSPDGRMVASSAGYNPKECQYDPTIRIWRTSDGTLLKTFEKNR